MTICDQAQSLLDYLSLDRLNPVHSEDVLVTLESSSGKLTKEEMTLLRVGQGGSTSAFRFPHVSSLGRSFGPAVRNSLGKFCLAPHPRCRLALWAMVKPRPRRRIPSGKSLAPSFRPGKRSSRARLS